MSRQQQPVCRFCQQPERKGSEAARLSKVGSVGIPIEQFPERSRASLIKFDANGDGKISTLELAEAASAFCTEPPDVP